MAAAVRGRASGRHPYVLDIRSTSPPWPPPNLPWRTTPRNQGTPVATIRRSPVSRISAAGLGGAARSVPCSRPSRNVRRYRSRVPARDHRVRCPSICRPDRLAAWVRVQAFNGDRWRAKRTAPRPRNQSLAAASRSDGLCRACQIYRSDATTQTAVGQQAVRGSA